MPEESVQLLSILRTELVQGSPSRRSESLLSILPMYGVVLTASAPPLRVASLGETLV